MDPLKQPVNTQPQPAASPPPGARPVEVPGLAPIESLGQGVKPPQSAPASSSKGLSAVAQAEDLSKLLVPVSAAGAAVLKPESFLGKKALTLATGFKVSEGASAVNKLTPGAGLFLLPEPLGFLPERFFMKKPQVPGTNVYLDPLYNYTKYRDRNRQEEREAAGRAQLEALQALVPTLTDAQLSALASNSALQARSIQFVNPRFVANVISVEQARRNQAQQAEIAALRAAVRYDPIAQQQALAAEAVATFLTGDVGLLSSLGRHIVPSASFQPAAIGQANPSGAPVANGSLQPEAIEPVNDAAKRNQDAARGINRELVSERADP